MEASPSDVDDANVEVVSDTSSSFSGLFLSRSKAAAATLNPFELLHDLSCEKINNVAIMHPSKKEAMGETRQNHPLAP